MKIFSTLVAELPLRHMGRPIATAVPAYFVPQKLRRRPHTLRSVVMSVPQRPQPAT